MVVTSLIMTNEVSKPGHDVNAGRGGGHSLGSSALRWTHAACSACISAITRSALKRASPSLASASSASRIWISWAMRALLELVEIERGLCQHRSAVGLDLREAALTNTACACSRAWRR